MTRSRILSASVVAAMLVVGTVTPAMAVTGNVDQLHDCAGGACNDQSTGYPSVNAPVAPGATQAVTLAQTFTPGVSGQLTDVSLSIGVLAGQAVVYPTSLDVRIVALDGSGQPDMGASPLASADVPIAALPAPGSNGWIDVAFATPATLVSGTTYAIALGPSPLGNAPWMVWQMDVSSAGAYVDYDGGEAMGASLPNAGPWSWNLMYDWVAGSGTGTADFAFRTYMVEATPTPTPSPSGSPDSSAAPDGSAAALTPPPTATIDRPTTDTAESGWIVVALLVGIAVGGLMIGRPGSSPGRR